MRGFMGVRMMRRMVRRFMVRAMIRAMIRTMAVRPVGCRRRAVGVMPVMMAFACHALTLA